MPKRGDSMDTYAGHAFIHQSDVSLRCGGAALLEEKEDGATLTLTSITHISAEVEIYFFGMVSLRYRKGAVEYEWEDGGFRFTPGDPQTQREWDSQEGERLSHLATVTAKVVGGRFVVEVLQVYPT